MEDSWTNLTSDSKSWVLDWEWAVSIRVKNIIFNFPLLRHPHRTGVLSQLLSKQTFLHPSFQCFRSMIIKIKLCEISYFFNFAKCCWQFPFLFREISRKIVAKFREINWKFREIRNKFLVRNFVSRNFVYTLVLAPSNCWHNYSPHHLARMCF
jgi:hypothetical protein